MQIVQVLTSSSQPFVSRLAGADLPRRKTNSTLSTTRGPQTENASFPGPCRPTGRHSPPGVTRRVTPGRSIPRGALPTPSSCCAAASSPAGPGIATPGCDPGQRLP